MQKITPCLWFDFNAEEAVAFYLSVFKDGKKGDVLYYSDTNPHGKPGAVLTIEFEIMGQEFVALNGGPQFPFTDAVSFMIECKDQKDIDYYWDAFLSSGGTEEQCGWIRDKFGLAWQVAPRKLIDLYRDPNKKKAEAAMAAMMKMIKIDIAEIEKAYNAA